MLDNNRSTANVCEYAELHKGRGPLLSRLWMIPPQLLAEASY